MKDTYQFFAVFSKLNEKMNGEKEKSIRLNEFKTLLSDAVQETGMVQGAPIIQRDKGIDPAGSNRTFGFDVYVPHEAMKNPESFDGEVFREAVELYINHHEHYSWMQVLTKDSDHNMGKASKLFD
jgi:hypothetical protein